MKERLDNQTPVWRLALLSFALACVAMSGCLTNSAKDVREAEKEVLEIRRLIGAGEFDLLYERASIQFRKATAKEDFIEGIKPYQLLIGNEAQFALSSSKTSLDLIKGSTVTLLYNRPEISEWACCHE